MVEEPKKKRNSERQENMEIIWLSFLLAVIKLLGQFYLSQKTKK